MLDTCITSAHVCGGAGMKKQSALLQWKRKDGSAVQGRAVMLGA